MVAPSPNAPYSETISETIAESKYNFLILNKDNDIVLTSLKRVSKSFKGDTLNDIKDAKLDLWVAEQKGTKVGELKHAVA